MSLRIKNNRNNTSGHSGVNWSKEKNKWHAKIGLYYRRIHLGYFDDLEEAVQVYKKAKLKFKDAYQSKRKRKS